MGLSEKFIDFILEGKTNESYKAGSAYR